MYHNKRMVLPLRKSAHATKNLFVIHDGTGRIDLFFKLSDRIVENYNIYAMTLDHRVGYIPIEVTIQTLAKTYIEQIKNIQPVGPYYIIGMCIGGTIAFEVAAQLENHGEEVGLCGLLDTFVPGSLNKLHPQGFSVASEVAYITPYLLNKDRVKRMLQCHNVEALWTMIKEDLMDDHFDRDLFIQDNPYGLVGYIINPHQIELVDMFYQINIIRTLSNARAIYQPQVSVKQLHIVHAKDFCPINLSEWEEYCDTHEIVEVEGEHYTMLDDPYVEGLAQKINQMIQNK